MTRDTKIGLGITALILIGIAASWSEHRCVRALVRWGVEIPQCPTGDVHPVLNANAYNLRRGQKDGVVELTAEMVYVVGNALDVRRAAIAVRDPVVELVRDGKKIAALALDKKDVTQPDPGFAGHVTLPADLKDGDYVLRAHAHTKAGDVDVDVPLPVYAPAKVHLITDRPLYQPGNTVKFRAVVLRARDLVPLDARPGRFSVVDPNGTVVLDERADAGDFGVADAELPLDKSAPAGIWHVRYTSGAAVDDVSVEVKPFTLPRFTVSVDDDKPFYRRGDAPKLKVKVAYASGVPVADASLTFEWSAPSANGQWPAPPEWLESFPKTARTDRAGHVDVALPKVPFDLMGKSQVNVVVTARDDTGDEQTGGGVVSLSEDAIDVQIATELGNHTQLVEGVNNRAWLRATTAAGVPLANVSLTVRRAWDAKDKGTVVDTDEDGVAVMQIDPGPAVNIVIPPMPIRLPPPAPPVQRTSLSEMFRGDASLADVAAIDRWNTIVARDCARFASRGQNVEVNARVDAGGRVVAAFGDDEAGSCIARAVTGQSLSAGGPRLYKLAYTIDPPLATLREEQVGTSTLPSSLAAELSHSLLDARECLGRMTTSVALPRMLVWQSSHGQFSGDFERDPSRGGVELDEGRARCVEAKLGALARARALKPSDGDASAFGAVRLAVEPVPLPPGAQKPQATTMLGYELAVSARDKADVIGDTKLRVTPGVVPTIRLRASKVIADPGDEITIDILRGPDFHGEIPKQLVLASVDARLEADVDAKTKSAKFTLPKDKDGWYQASFDQGIARVFVPKREALFVDVVPDKRIYRPGERAKLSVVTKEHDHGVKAAVGLIGVDQTLEQLAPLPGPGAMERLAPTVQMERKAFDAIDATALSLGRVRGKNAAAAAVLFVSSVPSPEDLDVTVSANAQTTFDPILPLADRFYAVLEQLYAETRRFESTAAKDEKITPQKMLDLWERALDDAGKKGAVTDAFGRRLKLQLLPDDLIALTDPRVVVADGTRLPEDVEPWVPFVKRSAP